MVTIIKAGFMIEYNFTLVKLAKQDIPTNYLKEIDVFLRGNLKDNERTHGYGTITTKDYKIEYMITKLKENCYQITFIKIIKRSGFSVKRYTSKGRCKNKIISYTRDKQIS